MESYSYSYNSSSSSSHFSYQKQEMKPKPPPSFHSSLHSVRKPSAKILKKPIAPLPPTPPRFYKVDSADFKVAVQRLTSEPEFQCRRLQSVAPPPLKISTTVLCGGDVTAPLQLLPSPNKTPPMSPLGFTLSPSSLAWCSFALPSPGTLSSLGQSTVL